MPWPWNRRRRWCRFRWRRSCRRSKRWRWCCRRRRMHWRQPHLGRPRWHRRCCRLPIRRQPLQARRSARSPAWQEQR
ncbi:MAG: hypothetical protein E5V92_17980 [Mesorhizobium sp.]|nr:MAG: hypothetical protein EOS61_20390 [Mesorhizobium sp.]TJW83554.1 MAG: hypothetical protein E5V92_17980 [Mesorhizobium sp.]